MPSDGAAARPLLRYFTWAFIVTAIGLMLGAYLGWQMTGTFGGMLTIFFICTVLAVLEISLSFDNAIVNANKLKEMTPVWQRRFLTWGILIAVFGMRLLFPIVIVAVSARLSPSQAVHLALTDKDRYQELVTDAHPSIAAFGGPPRSSGWRSTSSASQRRSRVVNVNGSRWVVRSSASHRRS